MKNEYGNFVIQKALKLSQNLNRKRLVKLIQKNVDKIGDKKLVVKWKNIVNSFVNSNIVFNRPNAPYLMNYSLNNQNVNTSNFINQGVTSPFSINETKFLFSPQYSNSGAAGLTSSNSIKKPSSTSLHNNSGNVQSNAYYCFYEPK